MSKSDGSLRVAIDATALGSGRGGDETLLRGLLLGLAAVAPADGTAQFSAYVRPEAQLPPAVARHPAFHATEMPWGRAPVRWSWTLPRMVRAEFPAPDLLLTQIHAPLFPPVPLVLQLTDLSFVREPHFYPLKTRLRLNILVRLHAMQARAVIVISEFSRGDVLAIYGLDPRRVFVVPCAVEAPPDPPPLSRAAERDWLASLGIHLPFFMYVGNLHARKNVVRLIDAFCRARASQTQLGSYQLVIAGGRWFGDGEAERAARAAPAGSIVFTGRVSDDTRDRLLRLARALVYVPLFEGFGLPPIEAMVANTPVLASNTAALPEVAGDAALLVNPYDVGAIADGLMRLATDDGLCDALRERGRRQAARYSVRAVGQRAYDALRAASELLETAPRSSARSIVGRGEPL